MVSNVQSIIFDKRYGWDKSLSKIWLRKHNKKPIKVVHETKHFLRYRMKKPEQFKRFRIKKDQLGVDFVIGFK